MTNEVRRVVITGVGAGAGSIWLLVLIISDIQLLLWYKKLKAAKLSKALHH